MLVGVEYERVDRCGEETCWSVWDLYMMEDVRYRRVGRFGIETCWSVRDRDMLVGVGQRHVGRCGIDTCWSVWTETCGRCGIETCSSVWNNGMLVGVGYGRVGGICIDDMSIEEELCYGKVIVLFNVTAVLNLAHAQSVPGVANVINNKKQNVKNGEKLLCFRKPTSRKFCGEKKGIRFFKFPKGSHKRRSWIQAMNRKDWVPNGNSFVCSAHFVYGWHSYETFEAAAKDHKEREDSMLHMSTAMHTYCGDGKSVVDEVVQTGSIEYHDDISITFTEDKGD
ncbi:hypothetical protein MAR_018714 [Mya arenaria]|uniref:THAP-type domain-containing protein n=1 Tax=Mya arenaria TaxID=6604 RepID=A0ABY7ENI7_MYAAR|nr:hypothetical protein MAR_018714 [Mya arenaria]